MKRNLTTVGIAALVLALPLTTASSVLAAPGPQTGDLESLGTSQSNDTISSGVSAEAHKAERNESGNILSVTWSVENTGVTQVAFSWPAGTTYMYNNHSSYSGVTVTSSDESNRYHPLMDSEGDCLCSGNTSLDSKNTLEPGDKVAYWSMFSVPSDVDSINLEIPGFDVIEDIPIS
jgi:hypothetical protein